MTIMCQTRKMSPIINHVIVGNSIPLINHSYFFFNFNTLKIPRKLKIVNSDSELTIMNLRYSKSDKFYINQIGIQIIM